MLAVLRRSLSALWRGAKRVASAIATAVIALILIFEEWGWRPLAELLSLLARYRLWSRLEGLIASLPPYPALLVFALPTAILLPVKFGALWLLAHGNVLTAGALLVGAKIVSTALVARIFMLTKPALMQLAWFARLYHLIVPWKDAVFERLRASWAWRYGRMLKHRVMHEARQAWRAWQPRLRMARGRLAGTWTRLRLRLRLTILRNLKRLRTTREG